MDFFKKKKDKGSPEKKNEDDVTFEQFMRELKIKELENKKSNKKDKPDLFKTYSRSSLPKIKYIDEVEKHDDKEPKTPHNSFEYEKK